MNLNLILAAPLLGFLLSGCGTMAIVDKSASPPGPDESILVFRVSPDKFKLIFFPGSIDQGSFRQDPFLSAVINGVATDGYLVARVKVGQTVGLMTTIDTKPASLFENPANNLCGGTLVPVFEVPKAKVAYVADIEISRTGREIALAYSFNLEQAAAHVRANYPNLSKDVHALPIQVIPTARCPPAVLLIPVPVSR